ncbi:uncharacterized protein LOC126736161 [Anthonomus grandis grandis]|uniref:uncharacterized protein LOC126736161 n=1 Tax=Anthonomus grandis grandis TaxID=2921223 RepID=UPI0021658245|nr:uncharacterized protein LOC126736161 [Anthonomus grandis grandis]
MGRAFLDFIEHLFFQLRSNSDICFQRESLSHVPLLREIKQNEPMDFKNYLRMDSATFGKLLSMVKNGLTKQHTAMREPISPEQRLTATLRFLATGRSYEDLKYSVGISAQALGYLIPETCAVIFEELKQEYLKFPTCKEDWRSIASGFESRWNFPNCAGALDGKHIQIVPPPRTGALYYNYKKFYSVILMALVKANCEFIYVDVGKQGRMSDSAAFEWTSFYKKLLTDVELVSLSKRKHGKASIEAKNNRDKYCEYFNHKGKLDWQDKMIEAGKA